MTRLEGKSIGIVGALAAFPRRMAAREVARRGATLRRGGGRNTAIVVFGHGLLRRDQEAIEARVAALRAPGRTLASENGFLTALGLLEEPEPGTLGLEQLCDRAGLPAQTAEWLALFDAFTRDSAPFAMRDLLLARKYAGLLASGVSWSAIARAVHRAGQRPGRRQGWKADGPQTLTALDLETEGDDRIYARFESRLGELDGQYVLGLGLDRSAGDDSETVFEAAEDAEATGRHEAAAQLYGRCLQLDPGDAVAAFNRANCLAEAGRDKDAALAYMQAVKLDPDFVEAWFNLAALHKRTGRRDAARRHLERAVALDADYADAVYNLAALAFEDGDYAAADRLWRRYLELDSESEWARNAARGLSFIALESGGQKAG